MTEGTTYSHTVPAHASLAYHTVGGAVDSLPAVGEVPGPSHLASITTALGDTVANMDSAGKVVHTVKRLHQRTPTTYGTQRGALLLWASSDAPQERELSINAAAGQLTMGVR